MNTAAEIVQEETVVTFPERVMELRERLFGVQAVVDLLRQAISSEREYSQHRALSDAWGALDTLAADMEVLAVDMRGTASSE